MNEDFKSTPRTDKLLSDQQFDNVDYDTSAQQLAVLCKELERELNEALFRERECEEEIKYLTNRAQGAEHWAERYRLDCLKLEAKKMELENNVAVPYKL